MPKNSNHISDQNIQANQNTQNNKNNSTWQQLTIISERKYLEDISNWLNLNKALSLTIEDNADQPIYEPAANTMPVWDEVIISGLFNLEVNLDLLIQKLNYDFSQDIIKRYEYKNIFFDLDAVLNQKNNYEPICIADKFWLYPYEQHPDPKNNNICYINIEPGLAFGSGEHPTTLLCLDWLTNNLLKNNIGSNENLNIIDYGCGSGILSIAAAKLALFNNTKNTKFSIYAIDNDPQAITATKENIKRNNINQLLIESFLPEEFKNFTESNTQKTSFKSDLIIANILAGTLIELSSDMLSKLKPGGTFVLSGILKEQADEVALFYTQMGAHITEIKSKGAWVRIVGQKTATT